MQSVYTLPCNCLTRQNARENVNFMFGSLLVDMRGVMLFEIYYVVCANGGVEQGCRAHYGRMCSNLWPKSQRAQACSTRKDVCALWLRYSKCSNVFVMFIYDIVSERVNPRWVGRTDHDGNHESAASTWVVNSVTQARSGNLKLHQEAPWLS